MSEQVSDGRNLIRTSEAGQEIWRATPPLGAGSEDCFTHISFEPAGLKASTWSGYEVAVDMQTGKITVQSFTK